MIHKHEIFGQALRVVGIGLILPGLVYLTKEDAKFWIFLLRVMAGWIIYDAGITLVVERQLKDRLKKSRPWDVAAKID